MIYLSFLLFIISYDCTLVKYRPAEFKDRKCPGQQSKGLPVPRLPGPFVPDGPPGGDGVPEAGGRGLLPPDDPGLAARRRVLHRRERGTRPRPRLDGRCRPADRLRHDRRSLDRLGRGSHHLGVPLDAASDRMIGAGVIVLLLAGNLRGVRQAGLCLPYRRTPSSLRSPAHRVIPEWFGGGSLPRRNSTRRLSRSLPTRQGSSRSVSRPSKRVGQGADQGRQGREAHRGGHDRGNHQRAVGSAQELTLPQQSKAVLAGLHSR
jgi:hypothetical protein